MATLDLENSESAVAEKMGMAKPPFFAGNESRSHSSAEHISKRKFLLCQNVLASQTIQKVGIIQKLSQPTGGNISVFVWRHINSAHAPMNRDDGGLLSDTCIPTSH